MPKISTLKKLDEFTLNGQRFVVKEVQPGKIWMVVRMSDHHLFALTGDTEIDEATIQANG